jgi:hypothetical protein
MVYGFGSNGGGQLGLGAGSSSSVTFPTVIPTLKNVVQIVAGSVFSLVISTCDVTDPGYSGGNCQYPMCYGISSMEPSVCSGLGECVARDVCRCFPPTFGDKCQSKEYHWALDRSGSWCDLTKWGVKRGTFIVAAPSIPTTGDTIYIDSGSSTQTIQVDVNVNIDTIYIRGTGILPLLEIQPRVSFIAKTTFCDASCLINMYGSSISFGTLTLNGVINYYGDTKVDTNKALGNSLMNICGTFNFLNSGPSMQFLNANITIMSGGVWNHNGSAPIASSGNTLINNFGTFTSTKMDMDVTVMNMNVFIISGQKSLSKVGNLVMGTNSKLYLMDSTLVVTAPNFHVGDGYFYASGTIQSPNFIMDTKNGYFQLLAPYKLNIIGDANFTSRATVLLTLNGLALGQSDTLNVTGNFLMNSLTLLRLGSTYTPTVDDQVAFITCGGMCQSTTQQVYLLGAPYKNAKYTFASDSKKTGYVQILFSYGSVDNTGYQCTYLGDKRILEMNQIQNTWMLSLTIPMRFNTSIGFGFDFNGTIDNALLTLSDPYNQIQQIKHNAGVQNIPSYLGAATTISQTIFGSWSSRPIGPSYMTINIIVPNSYLINQKWIYYAELPPNVTNITSHSHTSYEFSILHTPYVPCTNFLQPTRVEVYSMGVTITLLIVYVILFILCILLSRVRPLNTRGVSPVLTLFFLFTQLILETRNYAEISDLQQSLCIYYTFAMYPLQQIVFVMILLYFLRYFAIININENKKNIYTQITLGHGETNFQQIWNRIPKYSLLPT